MTTTEFIPGKWYPIETAPIDTLALFGNVNWEAQGKRKYMLGSVTARGLIDCLSGKGDFTAWSPIPPLGEVKPPKPKLPTVPEFLRDGVRDDDIFFTNNDTQYIAGVYRNLPDGYPIGGRIKKTCWDGNGRAFSLKGWAKYGRAKDGDRQYLHIVRVERNGVTVAEGQVYDD